MARVPARRRAEAGAVPGRRAERDEDRHVPTQPPSLALLEITNNPAHKRRIIKNNLQELSVLRALFLIQYFLQ